jgi:hypothetical protein
MNEQQAKNRNFFRHPLAALGVSLVFYGGIFFFFLVVFDLAGEAQNPYMSIITFVLAPGIIFLGVILLLVSVWVQGRAARLSGEKIAFDLSFDPTTPSHMRKLWLVFITTVIVLLVIAYTGTKAHDAVDSVAFCGETCHAVMGPEYITYHNSPHARVACVECHIGPGLGHWLKAKVAGMRQLYAVAFNTYERPIPTPVHTLRPAQETCETCHWPRQFYGNKLVTHTYYRTDEENSPWTIKLMVKIGGGNPRTGKLEGIHWHMLEANKIEYIATDTKRQEIPWVRSTHEGKQNIFTRPGTEVPDPNDPNVEVRRFDCMDCHNRPSHNFLPPAKAMNLALSTRRMSPELPFIRRVGLELLNAEYKTHEEAVAAIQNGLREYYEKEYPEIAQVDGEKIKTATETLMRIYSMNFFPEMKTDYRTRENNLSHFVDAGCFRCHDGTMQNEEGKKITKACSTCHLIVAQGPSENLDELESNIGGLNFKHPIPMGGIWKQMKCIECHTKASGY